MSRLIKVLAVNFFLFLWAGMHPVLAQSPALKFELANPGQTIVVGDTFSVKININTGGQDAINGDALFTFDPARVSINSATTGNFFTYFSSSPLGGYTNKYLASSWEENIAHAKNTSTDTLFATLSLSAVSAGTTSISFDCTTGSESDSNINRASDSKDIITCPLQPLSITIGSSAGGSSPTPGGGPNPSATPGVPTTPPATSIPTATKTPSPTRAPTSTKTPTPFPTEAPIPTDRPTVSVIPRAGITAPTLLFAMIGTLLTVAGVLIIL